MKTQKQVEAWLRIKINNLQGTLGSQIGRSRVGLKRMSTRLHLIADQLDEYIKELKQQKRR